MQPPLRKMPPLAAAATECRLSYERPGVRHDAATGQTCSVRLHGDLRLTYLVRAVGGRLPRAVRVDLPRRFDHKFFLYDPDTFFRSYLACGDIIHQMLAQTPVVGEFYLADHNWDHGFLPHDLAISIVGGFPGRAMGQNMDIDRRRNIDIRLTIRVAAVYSDPRALLRACQQTTVARRRLVTASGLAVNTGIMAASAECCVCMEDLAAPKDSSDDTVMLPCSHLFHSSCLLPWFHKESTCPMCRRDMVRFLIAVTRTPKGRFPGLEARVAP
ncbi:unnamed protein product [Alopecurus aequalis]